MLDEIRSRAMRERIRRNLKARDKRLARKAAARGIELARARRERADATRAAAMRARIRANLRARDKRLARQAAQKGVQQIRARQQRQRAIAQIGPPGVPLRDDDSEAEEGGAVMFEVGAPRTDQPNWSWEVWDDDPLSELSFYEDEVTLDGEEEEMDEDDDADDDDADDDDEYEEVTVQTQLTPGGYRLHMREDGGEAVPVLLRQDDDDEYDEITVRTDDVNGDESSVESDDERYLADRNTPGPMPRLHPAGTYKQVTRRCEATSKRGTRCSRKVCRFGNMCWQHYQLNEGVRVAKRSDGRMAMSATRTLPVGTELPYMRVRVDNNGRAERYSVPRNVAHAEGRTANATKVPHAGGRVVLVDEVQPGEEVIAEYTDTHNLFP